MQRVNAIRGMPDILPAQTALRQHVEACVAEVASSYGYREIRVPVLEKTELFKRSIGEVTDIVEKEMYSFADRHGEGISLRPEGTAGVVRAVLQHGLLDQSGLRLWYGGPMFRYERPQKGRQRQFHQIGLEAFGFAGPDLDAELILLCARLWKRLGISDQVRLELNSLGEAEARRQFRSALINYLSSRVDQLDEDSRRRLETNPLRILDSKNDRTQAVLDDAPSLADYLDSESSEHFQALCAQLDDCGISYRLNPRLVRGLDYYSRTVFEWVTEELGAQGTVCAGGRYDGLIEQLGGKPHPAVGLAIGMERLQMLVEKQPNGLGEGRCADIYVTATGTAESREAMRLSEMLRDELQTTRIVLHCGGGSLKSQMKRADRSGAKLCVLIGPDELLAREVTVRNLRGEGQQRIPNAGLADYLRRALAQAAS